MSLDQALAYFRKHQGEFAKNHHGKLVLIHVETVEGFYENELEAYADAQEKFKPGEFLIRKCIRKEEEAPVIFHSRVA